MTDTSDTVTPVSSQHVMRLSHNTQSNWLSTGRHSNARSSRGKTRHRHYPYYRTASNTRRLHASCSAHRPTSRLANTAHTSTYLKGLVNKTWRVHRMSPMHKFSVKSSSLRVYSRHLSTRVKSVSSNALVAVDESADLARIKQLKLTTTDENKLLNGIEIELLQEPNRGGAPVVVLTVVMCSAVNWSADVTLGGVDSEFMSLPLVLVRGPVRLSNLLFTWWQSQFDCCINAVNMSPKELSWMVAMFTGFVPDSHAKDVELVYKMPDEITALSRIVYRINPHDCQQLWLSIHSSNDDSFHSDEVVAFINALEEHFYQYFKIKLAALRLSKVGTSIVSVNADGSLKMFCIEHVLQILSHLVDVVREEASLTG